MRNKTCFIYSIILFLFLAVSPFSFAQKNRISLLKAQLEKANADSAKIRILTQLGREYLYTDSAQCFQYSNTALLLSEKNNDQTGIAKSLCALGNLDWVNENNDKALEYYLRSLAIYEKEKDKMGAADVYTNIGHVYYMLGNSNKALDYYTRTGEIYNEAGRKDYLADVYNNIGAVHNLRGENEQALEVYLKAIKILEQFNNDELKLNLLNNIGNTYHFLKQNNKAVEYLLQSVKISEMNGNEKGLALAYDNIASIYGEENDPDKVIEYAGKGLIHATASGSAQHVRNSYQSLAYAYAQKENYKKAYDNQVLYLQSAQNILSEEKNRTVHELESKYNSEKNQKEIELLNQKDKASRIIIYAVTGGLLLIIILSAVLINRFRLKQKISRKLEQQNTMMELKNEQLERLSIVASETENVILILDANGKLEWVNSSFERLNAITKDELIKLKGETIYEISNNKDIRKIIDDSVQSRKTTTYESLNITRDGKKIWESSTLTPIFDEKGDLKKLIIIDTDVTARKQAEEIIRQKNKDITDSINYASKIQQAFLPENNEFRSHFPDSFVLFQPKDIVSGDFYWISKKQDFVYFTAADCTGHGVPGGFMSMLGTSLLNEVVNENNNTEPSDILDMLKTKIVSALKQKGESGENKDGMDMSLCRIDKGKMELTMAAANNPVWLVRQGQVTELKADKQPVGISGGNDNKFAQQTISLQPSDCIYVFTDGYADQFGGPKGKKFKYKALQDLFISMHHKPMAEQQQQLSETIHNWRCWPKPDGNPDELEQVDDILVIGIRI